MPEIGTQIHRFTTKPSRAEAMAVWRAAKHIGDIPDSLSFDRHGRLEQTWWGWALTLC